MYLFAIFLLLSVLFSFCRFSYFLFLCVVPLIPSFFFVLYDFPLSHSDFKLSRYFCHVQHGYSCFFFCHFFFIAFVFFVLTIFFCYPLDFFCVTLLFFFDPISYISIPKLFYFFFSRLRKKKTVTSNIFRTIKKKGQKKK